MNAQMTNPKDRKLTKEEQRRIWEDMTDMERRFYGSREHFLEAIDVYENWAAPWSCHFEDNPEYNA